MTTKEIIETCLNVFNWICKAESTPTSAIHLCPLLVGIARRASHGRGSERRNKRKEVKAATWLYKLVCLISAN